MIERESNPDTPDWLTKLLEEITQFIETMPPMVGWETWLPENEEDGWMAVIYPGSTEADGGIAYPEAHVDVTAVLALFSSLEGVEWSSEDHHDSSALTVSGTRDGHDVTVTLLLFAPDGASPLTRVLPGDTFRWEELNADGTVRRAN